MSNYEILQRWAQLSGNELKAAVKADLEHNEELQRYVMAVLNPAVTYGITPKCNAGRQDKGYDYPLATTALLDNLAKRVLTGYSAKKALEVFAEENTTEAVELLNRALKKDLRCGVGATLINSLDISFKIPVFSVALCHPAEEKRFTGEQWLVGTKYDGMRTLIEVNDNKVQFFTRSGKLIPALDHLAIDVLEVFGGWTVMLDSEGVSKSFLEGMSQMRSKEAADDGSVVMQIFDCLPLHAFYAAQGRDPAGAWTLRDRLTEMHDMLAVDQAPKLPTVQFVQHTTVTTYAEILSLASCAWARGDEGVIARRADSLYTKARTHDWLKVKATNTYDGVIADLHEGEGKYAGMLGAASVDIDGVISKIGGGWSDWERAAIWAAYTGKAVNGVKPALENVVIGRLIECTCHEKMPSGALRHGNKKRFRDFEGEKA